MELKQVEPSKDKWYFFEQAFAAMEYAANHIESDKRRGIFIRAFAGCGSCRCVFYSNAD